MAFELVLVTGSFGPRPRMVTARETSSPSGLRLVCGMSASGRCCPVVAGMVTSSGDRYYEYNIDGRKIVWCRAGGAWALVAVFEAGSKVGSRVQSSSPTLDSCHAPNMVNNRPA